MKIFVIGGATVDESDARYAEEIEIVQQAMQGLGKNLFEAGHDLLVCSPFEGTVDLEAVRGSVSSLRGTSCVELHYPNSASVREEWTRLKDSLSLAKVRLFPYAPPSDENSKRLGSSPGFWRNYPQWSTATP